MARTRPYKEGLHRRLQDPEYAAGYLSECLKEGRDVFLLALRDVIQAREIALTSMSEETGISRMQLHRILSEDGNPTLNSLEAVLHSIGLDVTFSPRNEVA